MNLELKKGFFYIMDNEMKIIDCANIYSYNHENDILQRMTAKMNMDFEEKIRGAKII